MPRGPLPYDATLRVIQQPVGYRANQFEEPSYVNEKYKVDSYRWIIPGEKVRINMLDPKDKRYNLSGKEGKVYVKNGDVVTIIFLNYFTEKFTLDEVSLYPSTV